MTPYKEKGNAATCYKVMRYSRMLIAKLYLIGKHC